LTAASMSAFGRPLSLAALAVPPPGDRLALAGGGRDLLEQLHLFREPCLRLHARLAQPIQLPRVRRARHPRQPSDAWSPHRCAPTEPPVVQTRDSAPEFSEHPIALLNVGGKPCRLPGRPTHLC
jgi:hypothetical protein